MINTKIGKKQLLTVLILIAGLIALLILIKNPQIFKSKASQKLFNAIEVTNNEGNPVCSGNECETESSEVNFKLNIKELERLKNGNE